MKTKKKNIKAEAKQMTLTINPSDCVEIRLAGTDDATIDWGDDTECETHTLESEHSDYKHIYEGSSVRTITIKGRNITHLTCEKQGVTSLDVSDNPMLEELYCGDNLLTELDLSNNTALTFLACIRNQLTELDVSKNRSLKVLGCPDNQLTILDISKNNKLEILTCAHNQLIELDVSNNTELSKFDCRDNQLTSLDVSNNTELEYLACSTNQLSSLDTGNNTDLKILFCANNRLTCFDASKNTSLMWLALQYNQFSAEKLNNLFGTLPIGKGRKINVDNNPGTSTCNICFAENRGWECEKTIKKDKNTIQTNKGSIEIIEPDSEMIKQLNELLPWGLDQFEETVNGVKYGIVMQKGEEEIFCIKQQPLEVERKDAERLLHIQHLMIVDAYCSYLKNGFSGAYLAALYMRQRDNGLWEAGVSHFIFPSKANQKTSEESYHSTFDFKFGNGATEMFMDYVECFKKSFIESNITMPKYLGIDLRTRSHLQSLAMNFMVLDSKIICLRANLREKEDHAWGFLALAGINKVYHLPSVPLTIEK